MRVVREKPDILYNTNVLLAWNTSLSKCAVSSFLTLERSTHQGTKWVCYASLQYLLALPDRELILSKRTLAVGYRIGHHVWATNKISVRVHKNNEYHG